MPRALITGASSGIGREYAIQLARAGCDTVLVARREERLQELAAQLREIGVEADILVADLAEDAGLQAVCDRIRSDPCCDLVINSAGYASRAMVKDIDMTKLVPMLRINIEATVATSVAALNRMSEEGRGTIINMASGTVFRQMPGNAGYGSSKNFVTAFTRHMQAEAAETGVKVQLLIPGIVATEFHDVAGAELAKYPPEFVMKAEDLVAASLNALKRGELVCIPSVPDIADWDAYVAAEAKVAENASRDRPAERYS